MSFASDVKNELAKVDDKPDTNECCVHAGAYGLLITGRSFNSKSISLQTENAAVAEKYARSIEDAIGITPEMSTSSAGKTTVKLDERKYRLQLLDAFGHTGKEPTLHINRANFSDECCLAAFLRGAFLSCGAVTDPEKNYHLELSVPFANLCRDLIALLKEMGLNPKKVMRKGSHVIYFKESESIEDILGYMGAFNSSIKVMEVKVIKDVRNTVNRKRNFETANLSKTLQSSFKTLDEIKYIEKVKGKDYLPDELIEIAEMKRDNPELSLSELGQLLSPPLSRSGVNHRIKRISEIYESLKKEGN